MSASLTNLFPAPSPSASPPLSSATSTYRTSTLTSSSASSAATAVGLKHKVSRSPILIDLGESWIKLGVAGETHPRFILDTRKLMQSVRATLYDTKEEEMKREMKMKGWTEQEVQQAKVELSVSSSTSSNLNPYHTPSHWYPLLTSLFRLFYFNYLHLNPKDRRLILLENVAWSRKFKQTLVKVLYELDIPSLHMKPAVECVYYATMGMTTTSTASGASSSSASALLLDIGASETRVLPIYQGCALYHMLLILPIGVTSVVRRWRNTAQGYLRTLYSKCGGDITTPQYQQYEARLLSDAAVQEIISKNGYVQELSTALKLYEKNNSATSSSSTATSSLPAPKPYFLSLSLSSSPSASSTDSLVQLPTHLELPPLIRYQPFEVFFEWSTTDEQNASAASASSSPESSLPSSLHTLLLHRSLTPDIRVCLINNVVLSGGGFCVYGMARRVFDELEWIMGGRGDESKANPVTKAMKGKVVLHRWNTSAGASSTPSSAAITQPYPFSPNLLAWTGGSILGSLDLIEEDNFFLPRSELPQFFTGVKVEKEWIEERKVREKEGKRRVRTRGDGVPIEEREESEETDEKKQSANATDAATAATSSVDGTSTSQLIQLPPRVYPDWSLPSSSVRTSSQFPQSTLQTTKATPTLGSPFSGTSANTNVSSPTHGPMNASAAAMSFSSPLSASNLTSRRASGIIGSSLLGESPIVKPIPTRP